MNMFMRKALFNNCDPSFHQISHVCLAKGCDEKFLCHKCQPTHNGFHSSEIKLLQDLLTFDSKAKLEEIKDSIAATTDQSSKIKAQFRVIAEKVKQGIEDIISKTIIAPPKPYEVIEQAKPTQFLDVLSNELQGLKEKYMNINNPNDDNGQSLLSQYIKKYKAFNQNAKTVSAKNVKESSWSSLTHKELEERTSSLFNKIEEAVACFMNECFSSPLLNSQIKAEKEVGQPLEKCNKLEIDQVKQEKVIKLSAPTRWNSIDYIDKHDLIVIGNELGSIEVWKASEMKLLSVQKQHQAPINALKYYKKGDCMITASDDTNIKVSKIETMPVIDTVATLKEHKDKVWSLLVVEEHDTLYSSGKEACVIGWDLNTMKVKHKLDTKGKDTTGTQMAFISRLNLLAVSFKKGVINLYDIETPSQEIRSIKVLDKWLHALTYVESRDELIAGTDVGTIKVWNVGNFAFQPARQYKVPGGLPTAILPTNNDKELLVASGCNKLLNFGLESGECKVIGNFNQENITSFKILLSMNKILLNSDKAHLIVTNY